MGHAFDHKHVLFVDDDPVSRRLVEKVLRTGVPGARVTCVEDGAQALALLDREAVDLLITDVAMPVLGGIELILQVMRRRLSISLLVVSGQRDPQAESRALECGALAFFEKPVQAAPFLACVCKLLSAESRPAPLEVVSLAGLTRIIHMERRTCALRVTMPGAQGLLMFVAGELVGAHQGELEGLAAALRMLAWDAPSVALEPLVRACKRTIDVSLAELLRRASAHRRSSPGVVAAKVQPPTLPGPAPDFRARRTGEQPTSASPGPAAGPVVRAPEARPSVPSVPPPPTLPPPVLTLRSPPMASRTVTPPAVPSPPVVRVPPRVVPGPGSPARAPAAAASPPPGIGEAPRVSTTPAAPAPDAATSLSTIPAAPAPDAAPDVPTLPTAPALAAAPDVPTLPTAPALAAAPDVPTLPAAPALAAAPDVPTIQATPSAAPPTAPTTSAAPVEAPFSDDYFELVDRARELLRVAEFEVAERLLLRALQVRPGDRVVQQNLRVLARRRGPEAELNP
jgi:CheY-like chemotaxis protein